MRIRLIRKPANPITPKPMESKQTAVEWMFDKLLEEGPSGELRWHLKHDILKIFEQAKEMQQEELEKELNAFFLYFRDNGERLLGASIEQLVKSYMKSRVDEDKNI